MTRRARGRDKCLEVELPSGLRARVRGNGKLTKKSIEALDAIAVAAVKQFGKPRLAKPVAGVCSECGCTDEVACSGGCAWVNAEHTLCTACVPDPAARARGVRRAA